MNFAVSPILAAIAADKNSKPVKINENCYLITAENVDVQQLGARPDWDYAKVLLGRWKPAIQPQRILRCDCAKPPSDGGIPLLKVECVDTPELEDWTLI